MTGPDVALAPGRPRPDRWAGSRLRRHRNFALLWSGATASRLATEMYSVAIVLFVLAQTHSAHVAGLTVAAATFPTVLTGPVVGAWLDQTRHRRTAFLLSPVVLMAAMIGFLVAGGRDGVPDWLFVLLGFVAGLPSPVRTGGFSGLIPTVVPEQVLPRAYGFEAASYNIAGIAGPAAAGAVAGALGASWAIIATTVVAGVAVGIIARVPIAPGRREAARPLGQMLRSGVGLLWQSPSLRGITVATTVSQGAYGLVVVGYPLLVHDLHHRRALGGLLFSVFAVGALCGSVLYARLATRVSAEHVAYSTMVGFGGLLVGVGLAPNLGLALGASALAGFFDGPLLAATLDVRQQVSPPQLRTQVFTTAASLKIGAFAVGSALAGPAADGVGARGMLVLAGGGQVVAMASGLVARLQPAQRRVRRCSP
ncbi:MAG TPA: MFS transporter [Mycobacteriales bacterium]|nr:MFS transporter [Mycobacteriales bacterium]